MTSGKRQWHGLLLAVLVTACGADPATSRGRAELFLDAYYVLIDLPRAAEHTAGVARAKVEQGIALTEGQAAAEAGTRPRVRYQLAEEHPEGEDTVTYVYLANITADGDASQRKFVLTVRKQDEGWRVTNFSEFTP